MKKLVLTICLMFMITLTAVASTIYYNGKKCEFMVIELTDIYDRHGMLYSKSQQLENFIANRDVVAFRMQETTRNNNIYWIVCIAYLTNID